LKRVEGLAAGLDQFFKKGRRRAGRKAASDNQKFKASNATVG
jgi:hypothetical protein